jgi:peptidoglycan/xylan/chitin deacetylase (PgdA/CDA1 family)
MSLKHSLLAMLYKPLKARNFILRQFHSAGGGRIRVVIYHGISPEHELEFAKQINWLKRSWRFITPAEFDLMISSGEQPRDDCLLLTFDDGFISNKKIVKDVLNPLKIKGLFFVISEFANLSKGDNWRSFVAKNILPNSVASEIPDFYQNMDLNELDYLLDCGHTIGAHTASHARLSETKKSELAGEIVLSANFLEASLGVKIEHFAYTFGDISSFSSEALEVAKSRFKFIYTGLRGNNTVETPKWAIRRDSLSATDPLPLVGSFLEGGADILYKSSLHKYEIWGHEDVD